MVVGTVCSGLVFDFVGAVQILGEGMLAPVQVLRMEALGVFGPLVGTEELH